MSRTFKIAVWLLILSSVLLVWTATSLAESVIVRTEADLRAAAVASGKAPLTIFIDGMVKTKSNVSFPTTQAALTIVGTKPTSSIQFTDSFLGDWSKPEANQNGLELNGGNTTIYGLSIRNYNCGGSAVKYHGRGTLSIQHVSFIDCSVNYWAPKVSPPPDASYAFYAHCIGSHGNAAAIVISDCTFTRCATSQWEWSHCIYVSAPYVGIFDNTFQSCGNPLSLGRGDAAWTECVAGNKFITPAISIDKFGTRRTAYFSALSPLDATTYARNSLSGAWFFPWTGHPRPALHTINFNDYSAATFTGWAADTGKGIYIDAETWRKLGFDNNTIWPPK